MRGWGGIVFSTNLFFLHHSYCSSTEILGQSLAILVSALSKSIHDIIISR